MFRAEEGSCQGKEGPIGFDTHCKPRLQRGQGVQYCERAMTYLRFTFEVCEGGPLAGVGVGWGTVEEGVGVWDEEVGAEGVDCGHGGVCGVG